MLFQLLSNLVLISLEEKLTRHLAVHLVLHVWSRRAPTYHTIWTHIVSTWRWGRATLIHSSRTHWHILCGWLKSKFSKKAGYNPTNIQHVFTYISTTISWSLFFFNLLLFCSALKNSAVSEWLCPHNSLNDYLTDSFNHCVSFLLNMLQGMKHWSFYLFIKFIEPPDSINDSGCIQ